jgi:hypothetical protein
MENLFGSVAANAAWSEMSLGHGLSWEPRTVADASRMKSSQSGPPEASISCVTGTIVRESELVSMEHGLKCEGDAQIRTITPILVMAEGEFWSVHGGKDLRTS